MNLAPSAPRVVLGSLLDTADELRDDLAASRRECATWRGIACAALDQLAMEATTPERYARIQRDLLYERRDYMTAEFVRLQAPADEPGENA